MSRVRSIAERIHTGTADPDTSRALVVFNLTPYLLSGAAVFQAEMSWPKNIPLPPVVICELEGAVVPSALTDWREEDDHRGRADRRHISFALRFAVHDVPPDGWRTYLAAYTETPVPDAPAVLAPATPGLTVIETLRHEGDLPPVGVFGTFGNPTAFMV